MKRRRAINPRFLLFLLVTGGLLVGGVTALHSFQVRRNAGVLLGRADLAEHKNELHKAAVLLEHYLGIVPSDAETRARHALLLCRLARRPREYSGAFFALETALRDAPNRHDLRRASAEVAVRLGLFRDAAESFRLLVQASPNDVSLRRHLARCEQLSNHADAAIDEYERILELAPDDVSSYLAVAYLLRDAKHQRERADLRIERMLARNPKSARAHVLAARYYEAARRPERATELLVRARAMPPEGPDSFLAIARSYYRDNQAEEGRGCLERGLRQFPDNLPLHQALAEAWLRAGDRDRAVAVLSEAGRRAGDDPNALLPIVELFLDADALPRAAAALARLRQQVKQSVIVDYLQGRLLLQQGDWLAAERIFTGLQTAAASSDRLSKRVHYSLGQCWERRGKPDQARTAYRLAVQADQSWAPPHLALANLAFRAGNLDGAIEELQRMGSAPESYLAAAGLLLVRALQRGGRDWAEVDHALDAAASVLPGSLEVSLLRARRLSAEGRLEDARRSLAAVPAKLRRQAAYWAARAGLAEAGDPAEALRLLEEGQRLVGKDVSLLLARAGVLSRRRQADAVAILVAFEEEAGKGPPADHDALLLGLGALHERQGRPAEAARLYRRVAESPRHQNNLELRLQLFDLALETGDDAAMAHLVEEVRRLEGQEGAQWQIAEATHLLWQAEKGDKSGLEKAISLLGAARQQKWTKPRVSVLEGQVAEHRGHREEAIEKYREALRMGERSPVVVRRLVQLLLDQGRVAEVGEVLRQLPEETLWMGDLGKLAAEMALRTRNAPRALELARAAVSPHSKDFRDPLWLGQLLAASGEVVAAEKALRQAVELGKKEPAARIALVQFLAATGRRDQAEEAMKEAGKQLPVECRRSTRAFCLEALGRADEAEKELAALVEDSPDDPILLANLARFHFRQDHPDKAAAPLRRLVRPGVKAPPDLIAWGRRQLALVLAAAAKDDQVSEALSLLGKAKDGEPEALEDQRVRARVLARLPQRRGEAIQALEEVRHRQVLTADDAFLLATLYEADGQWPNARELLQGLLQNSPDQPRFILFYLDGLLRHQEVDGAAEKWLARLAELAIDPGTLVDRQVSVLLRLGKKAEALAAVRSYAAKDKANPVVIATLLAAVTHRAPGAAGPVSKDLLDEAERTYRELLRSRAEPEVRLGLAALLGDRGRVEEALELCEAVWGKAPQAAARTMVAVLRANKPDARLIERVEKRLQAGPEAEPGVAWLLLLADLRDHQRRYADVIALHRQVLRADSSNVVSLNNLAWFLAMTGENQKEALDLIDRALRETEPSAVLHDTRAVVLLRRKSSDEALKDIQRALALAPTADAYFHLAEAELAAGHRGAAAEAWRKARSLGLDRDSLHPLESRSYDVVQAAVEVP